MRLLMLFFLCLVNIQILAQKVPIRNQEFFMTLGFSDFVIDKLQPNENIDFLNYMNSNNDYIVLKLGYRFDFFSKMSADIKLIMMDDIRPDNYDVSVHYFIKPWVGIGIGSMLNKNFTSEFENFQTQLLPNYHLLDMNAKTFQFYDLGFYVSPTLKPIHTDLVQIQFTLDLGLSSFMKEETDFQHKKKLSNELLLYKYQTELNFQPYIQPKVDVRLNMFNINGAFIGLLLNSNLYYTNKSVNYNRSIQTWTSENNSTKQIMSGKHNYSRLELNAGLFLKW